MSEVDALYAFVRRGFDERYRGNSMAGPLSVAPDHKEQYKKIYERCALILKELSEELGPEGVKLVTRIQDAAYLDSR